MRHDLAFSIGIAFATLTAGTAFAGSVRMLQTTSYGQGADITGIVQGANNILYGTFAIDGPASDGAVFSFDPASNTLTNIHNFTGLDGSEPVGTLVAGAKGVLYGVTQTGGQNGHGVIYSVDGTTGAFTVLHSVGPTEATFIDSGLVADSAGSLYGTSTFGGPKGRGNVFKFDPVTSQFTVLTSFGKGNACYPSAALTIGKDGALYGVTGTCGAKSGGTVFGLPTTGGEAKTVHDFPPFAPGLSTITSPQGQLVADSLGRLYGSAELGGAANSGGLFGLDPVTRAYKVVHVFTTAESYGQSVALSVDTAHDLIGTSASGGATAHGTIFRLRLGTDALQVLYSFPGNPTDAALGPSSALIPGPKSTFYGAASFGLGNTSAIYQFK